jgi:hypothetical protein
MDIEIPVSYGYMIGVVMLFPLWLLIFMKRKRLRKRIVVVGVYVAAISPLAEYFWFLRDYWSPLKSVSITNFFIQEITFGFVLGGTICSIYPFFFKKNGDLKTTGKFVLHRFISTVGIIFGSFVLFCNVLSFNSIYASILGFIGIFVLINIQDPSLRSYAFLSALFSAVVILLFYEVFSLLLPGIFHFWWKLENISGVFLFNLPLEEIIWFFAFALGTSTVYDFWHSKQDQNNAA